MPEAILAVTIKFGFIALSIAFLLTFIRLVRGPSLPDRVVSLDVISILAIAFIALYSFDRSEAVYLDAAIALALVSFLGTVAFARYTLWSAERQFSGESTDTSIVEEEAESL